jgi:hypothetical protein
MRLVGAVFTMTGYAMTAGSGHLDRQRAGDVDDVFAQTHRESTQLLSETLAFEIVRN